MHEVTRSIELRIKRLTTAIGGRRARTAALLTRSRLSVLFTAGHTCKLLSSAATCIGPEQQHSPPSYDRYAAVVKNWSVGHPPATGNMRSHSFPL